MGDIIFGNSSNIVINDGISPSGNYDNSIDNNSNGIDSYSASSNNKVTEEVDLSEFLGSKNDTVDYDTFNKAVNVTKRSLNVSNKIILKRNIELFNNQKKCMVFYGPQNINFAAENDLLVIGFRYDEFAKNGINDDEWDVLHNKQLDFLKEFFNEIINNNNSIRLIKYNDFSCVSMKSNMIQK